MARNRRWDGVTPILPILVVVGVGLAALLAPAQQNGGLPTSDLAGTVDSIRASVATRWRGLADDIAACEQKVDDLRSSTLKAVAQVRGDNVMSQFARLSRELHSPVVDIDGQGLAGIYATALASELRLTNHLRDLYGAYRLLREPIPAADAVAQVRLADPGRSALDGDALDRRIEDREALIGFRSAVAEGASNLDAVLTNVQRLAELAAHMAEGKVNDDGYITDGDIQAASSPYNGQTLQPIELEYADDTSDTDFGALPGRVVDAWTGEPGAAPWIYLDAWYMLGPFDNRFRNNLRTQFAPESMVNLDEAVQGKDRKVIRWQYLRSKKARIEPEPAERGAIYYGFTEVWVEKAGNYHLSFGSDDYGKVWINDELVWESSIRSKPFRHNELVKELPLRAGLNRVLVRCENNGGTMGWAVLVHGAAGAG